MNDKSLFYLYYFFKKYTPWFLKFLTDGVFVCFLFNKRHFSKIESNTIKASLSRIVFIFEGCNW